VFVREEIFKICLGFFLRGVHRRPSFLPEAQQSLCVLSLSKGSTLSVTGDFAM